jgi:ribosomal protein S18 acetylase RimI-like enzyme
MPGKTEGNRLAVTIRTYRDDDLIQLLEIARELQGFELALHDRMMPVEDIGNWYVEALQARCTAEKGEILVAEQDATLLGYATIFTEVAQSGEIDEVPYLYAEISHVAVRASSRGAGVGKLLMAECEKQARSAGRAWIRINVLANNPAARGLYEQLGFHDHLIVMEKPLAGRGGSVTPVSRRSIRPG